MSLQAPVTLASCRVKIGPAAPDRETLTIEIARLRDLDIGDSGTASPRHLAGDRPFTCLATFCFGCSPIAFRRIISAIWIASVSACLIAREFPRKPGQRAADLGRRTAELRPGTVLGREWNGRMHRVAVLAEGFAWNGKSYPSLSKVALAITGTRWNGPKFFGLPRQPSKGSTPA